MKISLIVSCALLVGASVGVPVAVSAATAHPQAKAAAAKASLKLAAATALPGQGIKFTGAGFKAGELVTLSWKKTKLVKVKAGSKGTIEGTFKVPLPTGGSPKLTVAAVGATSKKQATAVFVQECTDEWTNLKGGSWSTAKDWSAGQVPGASTAACITLPGPTKYTVQLTGSALVNSLQVGAPSGKLTQTLAVNATKTDLYLTLRHAAVIGTRGVLVLTSASTGRSDYVEGPGAVDNYGQLETVKGAGGGRYLEASVVNEASGALTIATSTSQGSGSLTSAGTLSVTAVGTYLVDGGTVSQPGGHIVNDGTVQVSDGTISKTGGSSGGHAWQLVNGTTLRDKAGTGAYTYDGSGMLSGVIPVGQTIGVAGNGTAGVQLGLEGDVVNYGTLLLTSVTYDGAAAGDAWLIAAAGKTPPTLFNNGEVVTKIGGGGIRLLDVDIVNAAEGVLLLDAPQNWVQGGSSITSNGELSLGASAVLDLIGNTAGDANLTEGAGAVTAVTVDATGATSSVIEQDACPAAATACQTEAIDLAGQLAVTAIGTPAGSYIPIYSNQSVVGGTFAGLPAGYGVSYNQGPTTALPDLVGDLVLST